MNKNGTRKNLKPFKKGQSGNPKGRPKKILPRLDQILREQLGGLDPEDQESEAVKIIQNLIREAKSKSTFSKNVQAARELLDRAYGKVPDKIMDVSEKPKQITGFKVNKK